MAEEHRCQAPQLCANNCGFFGSPATQNLCSKCYRDLQLKEQQSSSAKMALNQSLAPSPSTTLQPSLSSPEPVSDVNVSSSPVQADLQQHETSEEEIESQWHAQTKPNRCMTCRRRVGLTGFKCRCGLTFCGSHRYPENHGCEFDFKGMGRQQIAKANPVVKAEKLEKI